MLESRARWHIAQTDESQVRQLADNLQMSPLMVRLLLGRGLSTPEQIAMFLETAVDHFHDPFLLKGMEESVARIRKALDGREKIRIYGDYDADGVSSTSLMIMLMQRLGASFDYYIPHRIHEGYGLNTGAIDAAREAGVTLIVTVDTGISAFEEVNYANKLGIDIIVTDHHEPPAVLPDAFAIINPKQPGCLYPFKMLAGVGVAFKLAHALLGAVPEELLEMAAIGTVADLMPLTDENRLLVKFGLEKMLRTGNIGIKALLEVSGVNTKEVNSTHVAFALAPRINASGRLDSADGAVKLLTSSDKEEAQALAEELDRLNKERQRIVEEMSRQAVSMLETMGPHGLPKVIVLAEEGWNAGVIGIVASKIMEKFYRPAIILSIDGETGMCKGSARSIAGFDIYAALTECAGLMEHFGGHQRGGHELMREKVGALSGRLNELAEEWLTEEDFLPVIQADLECMFEDVSVELIQSIEKLAPFGIGNPTPKVVLSDLRIEQIRTMGKDNRHIKLTLAKAEAREDLIEAIAFNQGNLAHDIAVSSRVELLGELSVNEWNGVRKAQILIGDIRVPHVQVFDWRGMDGIDKKKVKAVSEQANRCPVIVFSSSAEAKAAAERWAGGYACWTLDTSGTMLAWNETAKEAAFARSKDIILYAVPESVQQLQQVLAQAAAVERIYAVFAEPDQAGGHTLPSRDAFKQIYSVLLHNSGGMPKNKLLDSLHKRTALSQALIEFILNVFEELSFIEKSGAGYYQRFRLRRKRTYRPPACTANA